MNGNGAPQGDAVGAVLPDARSNGTPPDDARDRGSNWFHTGPLSIPSDPTSLPREGLDKLVMIIPILGVILAAGAWKQSKWRTSWWTTSLYLFDGCCVHISHGFLPKGGFVTRVEFNPARVLFPSSFCPAPVELLRYVLALIQDVVAGVVELAVPLVEGRISALHYAFDHVVEDPTLHVRATGLRPLPPSQRPHVYAPDGIARTAVSGNSHFRLIQYDKGFESKGLAPPGGLRTEVQLKSKGITPAKLRNVDDLTPERVRTAALKRIRAAGLDRPVHVGGVRYMNAALIADGWTERMTTYFDGFLVKREAGQDQHLGRSTRQRYNRAMRIHGVALDLEAALTTPASPCAVHTLNFDTCEEVILRGAA